MARKPPNWRKHGPPKKKIPLEQQSVDQLDAWIAADRDRPERIRQFKRVRRNKVGGKQSAQARRQTSEDRTAKIREAAVAFSRAGKTRYVPELVAIFGVSRSTVMRALRATKVCHEPNPAKRQ